jgi:hypothetical protein
MNDWVIILDSVYPACDVHPLKARYIMWYNAKLRLSYTQKIPLNLLGDGR